MSLFFKKIERRNLKDPDGPKLWYPVLRRISVLKEKEVATLIADETTLNAKEAEMALYQLEKVLLRAMLDGKTVQLGELGTFRLTISAEGAASVDEVSTDLIKKVNLRFLPSLTVREALQKATFVPVETLSE